MKINKIQIARHLRQEQTPAEKRLWELLRNRQFENLKFRRQHPLKDYIVDFYCDELELIIELDGGYHNAAEQKFKDEHWDYHLSFLGYKILRYQNKIVFNDVQSIFLDITNVKSQTPSQRERAGERKKNILSTKVLTPVQGKSLRKAGLNLVEYDAILVKNLEFEVPKNIENAIFTSQNGVNAFLSKQKQLLLLEVRCFCVGKKTKALLVKNGQKVVKSTKNASELADFIVKKHKNESFYFFCGNLRRDELPLTLKKAKINLFEVKTYLTELNLKHFDQKWSGILFFSPSGVQSYFEANKQEQNLTENRKNLQGVTDEGGLLVGLTTAFCIGNTTASEAKKYTNNVIIAKETTIESVIEKAIETCKVLPRSEASL